DVRQEAGRVGLEALQPDTRGRDLRQGLAVGRAGDGDADRAGRAVAGQADDAYVVAEVPPAELRADPEVAGQLEHGRLELEVTEAVRGHRAVPGQVVEVLRAGQLGRLERVLAAG